MRTGFSLVELSIVLVILGLLTGGILTGQNLIRAAELRSITTEFSGYQTSVNTFRDKYFAIPGDMRNATDFWGSATCPATAGTGTQTCNGDGNGQVSGAPAASQYGEALTFWQHLANAGLIEGNYTGIAGGGGEFHALIRTNVPASKLSSAGWSVFTAGVQAGDAGGVAFGTDYGTRMDFGAQTASEYTVAPILKPEEVWNIDTKIDDGKAGLGKVIARYWSDCTNATSQTDLDSDYNLSETGNVCAIHFIKLY